MKIRHRKNSYTFPQSAGVYRYSFPYSAWYKPGFNDKNVASPLGWNVSRRKSTQLRIFCLKIISCSPFTMYKNHSNKVQPIKKRYQDVHGGLRLCSAQFILAFSLILGLWFGTLLFCFNVLWSDELVYKSLSPYLL